MRSFIYLTLLPTLFGSTFAIDTPGSPNEMAENLNLGSGSPQDTTQPQELRPVLLGVEKGRTPPGSPPNLQSGSPRSPEFRSGQWQPLPNYLLSLTKMSIHGYKCQNTVYGIEEITETLLRACDMFIKKKKTNGVTRYPKILKDPKDGNNLNIIFPLSSSKYFGWPTPKNHFLRFNPDCSKMEVVYETRQKSQQASKHWCRLHNCLARGTKMTLGCKLLQRPSEVPEHFTMSYSPSLA